MLEISKQASNRPRRLCQPALPAMSVGLAYASWSCRLKQPTMTPLDAATFPPTHPFGYFTQLGQKKPIFLTINMLQRSEQRQAR